MVCKDRGGCSGASELGVGRTGSDRGGCRDGVWVRKEILGE